MTDVEPIGGRGRAALSRRAFVGAGALGVAGLAYGGVRALQGVGPRPGPGGSASGGPASGGSTHGGGAPGETGMSSAVPGSAGPASGEPAPVAPAVPDDPGRPVLVTTAPMIRRAWAAAAAGTQPFHRSWLAVRAGADAALGRGPAPYHGPDYITYFDAGRAGGWAARDLALAYHVTGDVRYADRARAELAAWAADASPKVGAGTPHSAGLVLGRVLPIFGDAYAMIWHLLSASERQAMNRWFRAMVEPVLTSRRIWRSGTFRGSRPPWLGRQYFNNHLTAQTLAIATIGFTVRDPGLISWAYDSEENPRDAKDVITGAILMPGDIGSGGEGDLWHRDPTLRRGAPAPEAGEIYDRQRMLDPEPHGLAYGLMHLQLLTLLAELAHNNGYGSDLYGFHGPQGENLAVALDYYADYLVTGDTSIKSGYYAREAGVPLGRVAAYELAYRHYRGNQNIRRVLENVDRVTTDSEFFARSAVLTHGTYLGTASRSGRTPG